MKNIFKRLFSKETNIPEYENKIMCQAPKRGKYAYILLDSNFCYLCDGSLAFIAAKLNTNANALYAKFSSQKSDFISYKNIHIRRVNVLECNMVVIKNVKYLFTMPNREM